MKVNSFVPEYMLDFKCIGSECTDTCCAGWDINIDELSFRRYEESSGDLRELIKDKYKKNIENHDEFNAGFMVLKDKNRCPFLNDKNLCDIHGNIGEEHLCITCKNYPRVFNIVDDVYEKSGLCSCVEVCRMSLTNRNKMEFVEAEEDIDEDAIEIRRIIDTESFEGTCSLLQYFWDIRITTINIIQNRKYTIEERLNILKSFFLEIEELKDKEDFEKIEEILEQYSDEEIDFDNLKGEEFIEDFTFYEKIKSDDLINNMRSENLKKCIEEYTKGINKFNNQKYNLHQYLKENTNCLEKLKEYSYIFENYLANSIFKDLIPFNRGENFKESISELINIYKIIKSYIIGIYLNDNKEINEESIIRVIQGVSKDLEHSKVFKKLTADSV